MVQHPRQKSRLSSGGRHKPFKSPLHKDQTFRLDSSAEKTLSAPQPSNLQFDARSSHLTISATGKDRKSDDREKCLFIQHRYTKALFRSKAALSELESTQQAIKIEQSQQDIELIRLINSWQLVSQRAAEEVFATARDRVNKMGGLAACRRREHERRELFSEWSNSGSSIMRNESLNSGIFYASNDRKVISQTEHTTNDIPSETDEIELTPDDTCSQGLTMKIMLEELGIDPLKVGFDDARQEWTDMGLQT